MSKLIRKLGKVFNSREKGVTKDGPDDDDDLQVDAVPTKTLAVIPRPDDGEDNEILESLDDQGISDHHVPGPGSQATNQANQFNSPNQTVYQFNHANGIHIGNNLTINQQITQDHVPETRSEDEEEQKGVAEKRAPVDNKALRKKYPKTRTIEKLLKSDAEMGHPDMDVIATHLGEDWRSVARDLGFSNGEIDQFYEDNFAYGVKEVSLLEFLISGFIRHFFLSGDLQDSHCLDAEGGGTAIGNRVPDPMVQGPASGGGVQIENRLQEKRAAVVTLSFHLLCSV